MKGLIQSIKSRMARPSEDEIPENEGVEEYVELNTETDSEGKKLIVRPYVMHEFEDIKDILDAFREGSMIALINIKPLKDKDMIELQRAISKLKKTCENVDGEIAGFGEDWIVITPAKVNIYRQKKAQNSEEDSLL